MSISLKNTSPYYLTPVKDWYLDYLIPRKLEKNDFDKIVIIPPGFNQRPDLMSNQEYGTPRLWWVFAMRNPDLIIDPINDFVEGLEIFVPRSILKT